MYLHTGHLSTIEIIGYVTLIQLWWIAVWGIAYIAIEYLSQKSKKRELLIYFLFISVVFCVVLLKPDLIRHF
jgi:hypothetical protein